ncbi:bifunctional UDP-N-acetylglucosamine diphosphorylase/glucosamine-1-phosphate N-acetyltransferase GlmU [Bdellovibrio sp. KM01]|uniref:bifunctional UDP-N-acetylglucosamine diphosphorylase/glucosamine-1-phosphate N-acetyltransferase GlmU n=1 Tax=Bdellovibrio sp. KM01 TaxID=2748865 RepID=UPI0015E93026|nr:bifunctional UDP-N-acetylglucosamine diphosphorylase/glucosamine-1-phosphate N-acetyltransferase GlmU [Bdellovibrio sp. KM01]QLY25070.1 bifunctional UDP-N-acetylglucosamine diphosphorylase/glucosamine-1-phosphate N-acetyltransferase GlmU [Bdellovibrio sp. KM01]
MSGNATTNTPPNTTDKLTVIALAAGKGTRMKSPLPKVLHPVAGRPMIEKVIQASKGAGATEVRVIVGHGQNLVRQVVEPMGVSCYAQDEQLGTAHAVRCAKPETIEGDVVIMNGDHPLIEASDVKEFLRIFRDEKCDLAVVTAELKNPAEFGRIVRNRGDLVAIVEAKDASAETLKIREINTGIYIAKASVLAEYLPQIKNNNSKKEFYITDLISLCIQDKMKVQAIKSTPKVAVGVNNQVELAKATRLLFKRKALRLMEEGVLMIDPRTTYIEDSVQIGAGTVVYPNVFIRGRTKIGSFSVIESNSFISDTEIGDSVQVRGGTYLESSKLHNKVSVGPYARLRPETEIFEEAHVGNFVEMKKTKFGKKSKAGHLTYLGDAEIGEEVNVGCGTITCNYAADKKKYKTKIGDRVFVGSDTQFVAPIEVGNDAVIGSGSTITKNVPANALAVARGKQFTKENYVVKAPEAVNETENK